MYKSFADLESGLDFFQTVSKNRPLPESAILLPTKQAKRFFLL